jgi:two-component system, LytTR family, sensor kinase
LVENAVKHNVISKLKPLNVVVKLEGQSYLSVCNNFQPKMHPEASTGFGLASLQRRYEMLTGKKVVIEKTAAMFKVSVPIVVP